MPELPIETIDHRRLIDIAEVPLDDSATAGNDVRARAVRAQESSIARPLSEMVRPTSLVEHGNNELPTPTQNAMRGRMVKYLHSAGDGWRNGTDYSPAVITNVWSNDRVNLTVLFDGQAPEPRGTVSHVSDPSLTDDLAAWDWPDGVVRGTRS